VNACKIWVVEKANGRTTLRLTGIVRLGKDTRRWDVTKRTPLLFRCQKNVLSESGRYRYTFEKINTRCDKHV